MSLLMAEMMETNDFAANANAMLWMMTMKGYND